MLNLNPCYISNLLTYPRMLDMPKRKHGPRAACKHDGDVGCRPRDLNPVAHQVQPAEKCGANGSPNTIAGDFNSSATYDYIVKLARKSYM